MSKIDPKTSSDFFEDLAKSVAKLLLPEVITALKSTPSSEDKTFDADEAAEYLNISKITLYRMCTEKIIPHMKMGGKSTKRPRLLFSSNSLDMWKKEEEERNYQIKNER
ncbi:helix-turn-helix domain-containing protein [Paenibacillus pabuli]|uniref:helix-turn-helix domain-containing protein n=1 Tax=Paenibacillus pabuli TaxID=1472 RepID=UPI003CF2581B